MEPLCVSEDTWLAMAIHQYNKVIESLPRRGYVLLLEREQEINSMVSESGIH